MNKQESVNLFVQIVYMLALLGDSNGQLGMSINFEGRTYFVSDIEGYPYDAEIMCHVLNSSLVTLKENLDTFSRNLPVDNYYWIGNTDNTITSGQCMLMKTGMNKTTYYQEVCSLKFKFICVKNFTMVASSPTMSVYSTFLSSMYNGSSMTNWSGKLTDSSSLQFQEPPMTTQLPTAGIETSYLSESMLHPVNFHGLNDIDIIHDGGLEAPMWQKLSTSFILESSRPASLSSSISPTMTLLLFSSTEIHSSVPSTASLSSASKGYPWSTFHEGCTDTSIYQPCTKYETFIMSSTVIVTMYSSSSSTKTANATPNCTCCINPIDTSAYNLEDILTEMAVDSKNTSKYTRKHTSVDDKRTSAKAIGCIGALVICSLFGALIFLDGKHFCKGFNRMHIRERRKNNVYD